MLESANYQDFCASMAEMRTILFLFTMNTESVLLTSICAFLFLVLERLVEINVSLGANICQPNAEEWLETQNRSSS